MTCAARLSRRADTQPIPKLPIETITGWQFLKAGVFCAFSTMKPRARLSNAPGNKVAACVCLIAVLLLWAPLWASAFQAKSMACCDGAMCPLHGNAPKKNSQENNTAKETQPTMCEHHARQAAMDCSVGCCHPADPAATSAVVFVLPALSGLSAPSLLGQTSPALSSVVNSVAFEPVSPPPRALFSR